MNEKKLTSHETFTWGSKEYIFIYVINITNVPHQPRFKAVAHKNTPQTHTHIFINILGFLFDRSAIRSLIIYHGFLFACIGMQRNKKKTRNWHPLWMHSIKSFSKLIISFNTKKYRRRCTAAHDDFFAILLIGMPTFDKVMILIINFANLLRHVQSVHAMSNAQCPCK